MVAWVFVAIVGGLLSIVGFSRLVGRYHRGEVRARYVIAAGVGYGAFVAYALLSALEPMVVNGLVTLVLLLPAFVAIVVLLREHQHNAKTR